MEFEEDRDDTYSNLVYACRNGNCETLKAFLENGARVDFQDGRGFIPIHHAAYYNQVDCLKLLLEQEENDVNWESFGGETPLLLASRNDLVEVVQLLLQRGANPRLCDDRGRSPLMSAVKSNSFACVKELLDAGADVNAKTTDESTALHVALSRDCQDLKIIAHLIENGAQIDARDIWGITAVYKAAKSGCLAGLEMLLLKAEEKGIIGSVIEMTWENSVGEGTTPLMIAASGRHVDCVELLLQFGADCNRLTIKYISPLHFAVWGGDLKCVQILLERMNRHILELCSLTSLDLSEIFDEDFFTSSPLHFAITSKCPVDALKLLLNSGLDPNDLISRTSDCFDLDDEFFIANQLPYDAFCNVLPRLMSPLGWAVCETNMEAVVALLEAGAEVNPKSQYVIHPIVVALIKGRADFVEHLLLNGAVPNCCAERMPPNTGWFPQLLRMPLFKANVLRLFFKYGADARRSFPPDSDNVSFDCLCTADQCFCVDWISDRAYNIVTVLQEFLGNRVPKRYIEWVYQKWLHGRDEESLSAGKQHWGKIFKTSKNPPTLIELCRFKVRECIMDSGSCIIPFTKLLDKLPLLPSNVADYLAFP